MRFKATKNLPRWAYAVYQDRNGKEFHKYSIMWNVFDEEYYELMDCIISQIVAEYLGWA